MMMKIQNLLLTSLVLLPATLPAAIIADFTAAEGYADGTLSTAANKAMWTAGFPVTWAVDTAATGTLTLPSDNSTVRARYVGAGSVLSGNNYTSVIDFTMSFNNGTSANLTAAQSLGRFELENLTTTGELVGSTLRQIVGTGEFNINLYSNTSGTNLSSFSGKLTAAQLGLAFDGTLWTDGTSDPLRIEHTVVFSDAEWTQTMSIYNANTSLVDPLQTITLISADADSSFVNANQGFLINTTNLNNVTNLSVAVDRIEVTAVPEPSTYALLMGALVLGAVQFRRMRKH